MKTFHSVTCVLFGFILFSCSDDTVHDFTFPDTRVELNLSAPDGTDLLNPDNDEALTKRDISVYYMDNIEGDNKQRLPQNALLIQNDSTHLYKLTISVNDQTSKGYSYTTIKWGNLGEDTIKCTITDPYKIKQIDKLWINELLMWEPRNGERIFHLVK